MYYILKSEFTIGNYRFRGCNECEISKSVWEYQDKAIIKLPTSAVLKQNGIRTQSVQTAMTFKVSDKVSIKLGYAGYDLQTEFEGFVSRINYKTPCEIECEGYSYLLRTQKNIVAKWQKTTLKQVLQKTIEGTEITLHKDIPDVPLNNIAINNATGIQVIDYLKGLLKGALTVCFFGKELYAGLAYMDITQAQVKHRLNYNTINSDNLKEHRADEVKVTVQIEYRKGSGEQVTVETGQKGGIVRKDTISAVTDTKAIKEIAEAKLKREQYNGYEGDFSTFLIPFCQPAYTSQLTDKKYTERGGKYFVESTKTTFGQGGGRRTIQIGIKL